MERFQKKNLKNIQKIFEEKTGAKVSTNKRAYAPMKGMAVVCMIICILVVSAFAYDSLSGLNGDELTFDYNYKGNGIMEVIITNSSDKVLNLQQQVRFESWKGGTVNGNAKELKLSKTTVLPHTTEKIEIDFSKGFDIEELEKGLPKGDWYYLVFTNNNFVFGQDWMCSVGFKGKQDDSTTVTTSIESEEESTVPAEYKLRFDDWLWPTESTTVCGNYTDHINISGNTGDDVYSVADGVVLETGFDTVYGNYVIMDFGNGVTVKYGHLKKILVESGDNLSSGKKIAILGQSGMATGPNLSFAVYADGEAVNPLSE